VGEEKIRIKANRLVNAAGPFINDIAGMLGTKLPVTHTLQQKIAFEDKASVIPRVMPFSIDLDAQFIDWSDDERALLQEDADYARYGTEMPGAIHCRPDGGDKGRWVKLGWAFNNAVVTPRLNPELNAEFPEVVLRGAARLNPALKAYYGTLPKNTRHYGGYYTLTDENWPLVGPMAVSDAYVVGALSGFGTMAACASGELCAQHVLGKERPDYAFALSPQRYTDDDLMQEIRALSNRGIL
jgi:glycine/D-amino acid oxidase-like deaminating enzyme